MKNLTVRCDARLQAEVFCVPSVTILQDPRHMYLIHNKASFYGEELLASHPTLKLDEHPLLDVSDCLLNIFAATLRIAGRSSVRNLRTRHVMVTVTHLLWLL